MKKDVIYFELKRNALGQLTTIGWEKLLEGYTPEQLETIVTKKDGRDMVECPVFERNEKGHITKWGIPVPVV